MFKNMKESVSIGVSNGNGIVWGTMITVAEVYLMLRMMMVIIF